MSSIILKSASILSPSLQPTIFKACRGWGKEAENFCPWVIRSLVPEEVTGYGI
jgi:hypothetical protein